MSRSPRAETIMRCWHRVIDDLADLEPADWSRPTRCHGWTLLDLARHAAWGTSMEADALRRARSGRPGCGQGVEPEGSDPGLVFTALRAGIANLGEQLAGLGDLGPDAVVTIPFGAIPASFALEVFTLEAGVHADDVAQALRESGDPDRGLEPAVCEAVAAVLTAVLPALAALAGDTAAPPPADTVVALTGTTVDLRFAAGDHGWEAVDRAGPPPTATVTGDDTAVLRFALGRVDATDPGLDVRGADGFKSWFPGP